MKKRILPIVFIIAALYAAYYLGTQHSSAPSDPVRSYTTVVPLSRFVIPSTNVPPAVPNSKTVSYIVNKSTKKFHKPNCSSVDQMKESNKIYFTGDREELIKQKYEPCGRCHP